jgi:hypothetical protein
VLKLVSMFLSPNLFSQLNLLQDLKLGAKRREESLLGARRHFFEVWGVRE